MWWANTTRTWTTIPEFWDFDPAGAAYGDTLDWPRDVVGAAGHVFLWFYSNKIRRIAPDGTVCCLVLDGGTLRFVPNTEPGQGHKLDARSPFGPLIGLFADHDRLVFVTSRELIRFENVETDRGLVDAGRYALPDPGSPRAYVGGTRDDDAFILCDGAAHAIWHINMIKRTTTLFAGRAGKHGHLDGPAHTALFSDPSHVCATKEAWFVTDRSNHVVRRIDRATRSVSTYGNAGTAGLIDGDPERARFERPRGICAAHGRIWIADLAGAVRCIDPRTHQVSTAHAGWPPSSVCAIPGGVAACSMQPPTLIALAVSPG